MGIADLPLVSALKTKMNWHQQRQKVLAENVANADTPRFQAKDLKAPDFLGKQAPAATGVRLAVTQPGHIAGRGGTGAFRADSKQGFETTPDGNGVNLEEQMMKTAENQMDFQAVAGLYQRGLSTLRTAIGRRS
ncbi:MAG: flagellar basal body rod protein FlgB [Hyphomicrobiaceae bacterium]|nr:flagellar basal body rod protein FlgB [Hyphomicrobiaceae bacterium]